ILVLSVILWFTFQHAAEYICHRIPDKWLSPNGFLFKERKWEKGGAFYSKVFKVKKWKKYLPDGAAARKKGYRKKKLTDFSTENLDLFLVESCRAELMHLLAIIPFWVFGLFAPVEIIIYMLIYALAVNLPCIIVQRFNRPRIMKLIERKQSI
ncbi:MAG: glycosyl-4,4'-diaponeurosporenoate acyltransferase, partial [Bacteroidota bacterium]